MNYIIFLYFLMCTPIVSLEYQIYTKKYTTRIFLLETNFKNKNINYYSNQFRYQFTKLKIIGY